MCEPISRVFFPCGHTICCGTCAERVNLCPICREAIEFKHPCFLPWEVESAIGMTSSGLTEKKTRFKTFSTSSSLDPPSFFLEQSSKSTLLGQSSMEENLADPLSSQNKSTSSSNVNSNLSADSSRKNNLDDDNNNNKLNENLPSAHNRNSSKIQKSFLCTNHGYLSEDESMD